MKVRLTALLLLAPALAGAADNPGPPKVPAELRGDLFKAWSTVNQIAPAWQKAQADAKATYERWAAVCGDKYEPKLDNQGEPTCMVKPNQPPPLTGGVR